MTYDQPPENDYLISIMSLQQLLANFLIYSS